MYRRTTNDNTYPRSTEGIEEKYIDVPLTMKITKYTNVPLKVNYQRPTGGRKRCIAVPLTITHTHVPLKVEREIHRRTTDDEDNKIHQRSTEGELPTSHWRKKEKYIDEPLTMKRYKIHQRSTEGELPTSHWR